MTSPLSESDRRRLDESLRAAGEFQLAESANAMLQPLAGPLAKFTNVVHGWQQRWFVLEPDKGELRYYLRQQHVAAGKVRGVIPLISAVISPSTDDECAFTMAPRLGDVLRLRAPGGTRDRQHWINRLRQAASAAEHSLGHKHTAPPVVPAGPSRSQNDRHPSSNISTATRPSEPNRNSTSDQQLATSQEDETAFMQLDMSLAKCEQSRRALFAAIDQLGQDAALTDQILLVKALSQGLLDSLQQCAGIVHQLDLTVPSDQVQKITPVALTFGDADTAASNNSHGVDPFNSVDTDKLSMSTDRRRVNGSTNDDKKFDFDLEIVQSGIEVASEVADSENESDRVQWNERLNFDGLGSTMDPWHHAKHSAYRISLYKTPLNTASLYARVWDCSLGTDLMSTSGTPLAPVELLRRESLLQCVAMAAGPAAMLHSVAAMGDAESRMVQCVTWYISAVNAVMANGMASQPYVPVLGEAFVCQFGSDSDKCALRVYAEQVCSCPATSCVYVRTHGTKATNEGSSAAPPVHACFSVAPRCTYLGMALAIQLQGTGRLFLGTSASHPAECYTFDLPALQVRSLVSQPSLILSGKVSMACERTGFSSQIEFLSGQNGEQKLRGQVRDATARVTTNFSGSWTGVVKFTSSDTNSEHAMDVRRCAVASLGRFVRPIATQANRESMKVWMHVNNALNSGNYKRAADFKEKMNAEQQLRIGKFTSAVFSPDDKGEWIANEFPDQ